MNEDRFWDIIALLDWSQTGDDVAVIAPCVEALSKMSEADICIFYDLLSEKLYHLDGRLYADHAVEADEYFSADLFLYARCAVVANGRAYYLQVLEEPQRFPKDLFFEAILTIPEDAWLHKTGTPFECIPKYIFETGFNPQGWGEDAIVL